MCITCRYLHNCSRYQGTYNTYFVKKNIMQRSKTCYFIPLCNKKYEEVAQHRRKHQDHRSVGKLALKMSTGRAPGRTKTWCKRVGEATRQIVLLPRNTAMVKVAIIFFFGQSRKRRVARRPFISFFFSLFELFSEKNIIFRAISLINQC
uniref:Uncharacterized protein n=1 Tax=Cacopsylla melanoneura TaxID=428564 RepID=A0A8D8R3R1_9HEMI